MEVEQKNIATWKLQHLLCSQGLGYQNIPTKEAYSNQMVLQWK